MSDKSLEVNKVLGYLGLDECEIGKDYGFLNEYFTLSPTPERALSDFHYHDDYQCDYILEIRIVRKIEHTSKGSLI